MDNAGNPADSEPKTTKKIYLPPGRRNPPAEGAGSDKSQRTPNKNGGVVQRRPFLGGVTDHTATYSRSNRYSSLGETSTTSYTSVATEANPRGGAANYEGQAAAAPARSIPLGDERGGYAGAGERAAARAMQERTIPLTAATNAPSRFQRSYGGPKAPTAWATRGDRRYYEDKESEVFEPEKNRMSTGINFNSYDNIPVQMTGHLSASIKPIEDFEDLVHPMLHPNIKKVNYTKPTPIQRHSIPVILENRDLMACAQTGSGKTAAFLLPIVTAMLKTGPPKQPQLGPMYPFRVALPVCLVLSPTRELAVQIYSEARKFNFGTGIRTVVLYGGSEVRRQLIELERGCDICVATPGRLTDLVERRKILFSCIRYLVLDEADRMLDMGFMPQIRAIVGHPTMPDNCAGLNISLKPNLNRGRGKEEHELPADMTRQTVMFSATFPKEIQQLAKEFLNDYIYLAVGRVGSTNEFIKQRLVYADQDQKVKYLIKLLKENNNVGGLVLIFVETKKRADLIEGYLLKENFKAVNIHGDRSQEDRERALSLFRSGVMPILVATDVAARGLDISNITHVINCDLPTNIDDYVHRIGRTGRAGNIGIATSLVNESNRPILKDLLMLLQESNQEVPPWFRKLVTQVSGMPPVRRVPSRSTFGRSGISRDIRNDGEVSTYSYNRGKGYSAHNQSSFREFEDDWW